MKTNKKTFFISIFILINIILLFSSCGNLIKNKPKEDGNTELSVQNKTTVMKSKSEINIGVSMADTSIPYYSKLAEEMEKVGKTAGVNLEIVDAKQDVKQQIKQLNDFVEKKVDAIIFLPVNIKSFRNTLMNIKEAQIPVINLNTKVDMLSSQYITSFVGPNVSAEAMLSAEMFIEALPEGGEIGIIETSMGNNPTLYKTQTFIDAMEKHPEFKIVNIVNGKGKRSNARLATIDLFKFNKDIDGIYCHNCEMAMGAIQAINELQINKKIIVTGITDNEEYFQKIKDGDLWGLVFQSAEGEAINAVYGAIQSAMGGSMRIWYKDPIFIIDSSNVDNYYLEKN